MSAPAGLQVTLNGNTQQLSALITSLRQPYVESVQLQPITSSLYVGTSTMTASTDAYAYSASGGALSFSSHTRNYLDLSKIYLKGTNNDKVFVSYIE